MTITFVNLCEVPLRPASVLTLIGQAAWVLSPLRTKARSSFHADISIFSVPFTFSYLSFDAMCRQWHQLISMAMLLVTLSVSYMLHMTTHPRTQCFISSCLFPDYIASQPSFSSFFAHTTPTMFCLSLLLPIFMTFNIKRSNDHIKRSLQTAFNKKTRVDMIRTCL